MVSTAAGYHLQKKKNQWDPPLKCSVPYVEKAMDSKLFHIWVAWIPIRLKRVWFILNIMFLVLTIL